MKEIVLPPLIDQPKILGDYVNTWTVENWRALGKKEHGPVFQAGDSPWYVHLGSITAASAPSNSA